MIVEEVDVQAKRYSDANYELLKKIAEKSTSIAYIHDNCGGVLNVDYSQCLTSMPPQHKATCEKCSEIVYVKS